MSDMMAVPLHIGRTVGIFVLLLCEISEQENRFVLCWKLLMSSNKTSFCLKAAHPQLVWLSVFRVLEFLRPNQAGDEYVLLRFTS